MSSRERILDAAMEIFARYGYRRASMDQVAEAAGLTRQAVYHHFPNKEALFRAGVEALHDGALEAAVAAGAAAEQAGHGLPDVLAAQVDAKTRYVIECMEETSHMEELLSQRQLQAGDLNTRSEPVPQTAQKYVVKIRAEINDIKHKAGIVSMARGEEVDSALTSFFIVLADQPPLDGTYTVFGRVIEGMDVVEKIAAVPAENERPKERVDIYSMKVERRK